MRWLLRWKKSKYRKPLVLKGVRQMGKTWLLKEFARRYYEDLAYFNKQPSRSLTPLSHLAHASESIGGR